jgi:hypothetical protein
MKKISGLASLSRRVWGEVKLMMRPSKSNGPCTGFPCQTSQNREEGRCYKNTWRRTANDETDIHRGSGRIVHAMRQERKVKNRPQIHRVWSDVG